MRSIVRGAVCLGLLAAMLATAAEEKRRSIDELLARQAAILATNRLFDNIADEDAFLLLQMASRIDPDNEVVKNTLHVVGEEMTPDPIETKYTEPRLFEAMIARADELVVKKEHLKLASLYYRVAQKLYPANAKSTLALRDLREAQNINFKIEELLGNVALFDPLPPPSADPPPKVEEPVEKPVAPPAPLLGAAKRDGKLTLFAWNDTQWTAEPLTKVVFAEDKNSGRIRDSYADAPYVMLCRNRVFDGDFDVSIELKGGKEVVLQVDENSEARFSSEVAGPQGWHTYRFARKAGKIRFWFDNVEKYFKKATGAETRPVIFGLLVWKNQEAEFKRFP